MRYQSTHRWIGKVDVCALLLLALASLLVGLSPAWAADVTIDADTTISDGSCDNSGDDVTIDGGVTVTLSCPAPNGWQVGSLTINGTVTHAAEDADGAFINATGTVIVNDDGIDVTGKGCRGGQDRVHGWTFSGGSCGADADCDAGRCLAGQSCGATDKYLKPAGGGGHGGWGGDSIGTYNYGEADNGHGGIAFGDSLEPESLGAGGGGCSTTILGGNGGGMVRIAAATVTLSDHAIAADGDDGNISDHVGNAGSGAGAGGSVWIDVGTLSGSGYITANGGIGGDGYDSGPSRWNRGGGGGGGGRIAIHYDNKSAFSGFDNTEAAGGRAAIGLCVNGATWTCDTDTYSYAGAEEGQAGTVVYLKNDNSLAEVKNGFDISSPPFAVTTLNIHGNARIVATAATPDGQKTLDVDTLTLIGNTDKIVVSCNDAGYDMVIDVENGIDLNDFQLENEYHLYRYYYYSGTLYNHLHYFDDYYCNDIDVTTTVSDTVLDGFSVRAYGNITFDIGETLIFRGSTIRTYGNAKSIDIENAASITLTGDEGDPTTDPSTILGGADWTADNLTIDSGSSINATGKGYAGGVNPGGGADGYGADIDDDSVSDAGSAAGGGQQGYALTRMGGGGAGCGAGGNGYNRSDPYGTGGTDMNTVLELVALDHESPTYPGGGGGSGGGGSGGNAGNGGGVVTLEITGTFELDGQVIADGADGSSSGNGGGGGGGGGSVWITAGEFNGSGSVQANGGDGAAGTDNHGGAGGGAGFMRVHYGSGAFDVDNDVTNDPGACGGNDDCNSAADACSAPADVRIDEDPTLLNQAPVASAGDDETVDPAALSLDGTGSSDADVGDVLTYAWTCTACPQVDDCATAIDLTDADTSTPDFDGYRAGVYTFSLVVNDGLEDSTADTVTITVNDSAPVVATPSAAIADDSATMSVDTDPANTYDPNDPDGDLGAMTYAWQFLSGPGGPFDEDGQRQGSDADTENVDLDGTDTSSATFPLPHWYAAGDVFHFRLTVTDTTGQTTTKDVDVSMTNFDPIIDVLTSTRQSELAHQLSYEIIDYNRDDVTNSWSVTSAPSGAQYTITNGQFSGDRVGNYIIRLSSDDGEGGTITRDVTVTVENVAPEISATLDTGESRITLAYTDANRDAVTLAASPVDRSDGEVLSLTELSDTQWEIDDSRRYRRGYYDVNFVGTDENGGADTITEQFLMPNNAPELTDIAATAGGETLDISEEDGATLIASPVYGNIVTIMVDGDDYDADALSFGWSALTDSITSQLSAIEFSKAKSTEADDVVAGFTSVQTDPDDPSRSIVEFFSKVAGTVDIRMDMTDNFETIVVAGIAADIAPDTTTQTIKVSQPIPNEEDIEDDVQFEVTSVDEGTVKGTVTTPVVPCVVVNDVDADISHQSSSVYTSTNGLNYDRYGFQANNVQYNSAGALDVVICTYVNGEKVTLVGTPGAEGDGRTYYTNEFAGQMMCAFVPNRATAPAPQAIALLALMIAATIIPIARLRRSKRTR